MWFASCVQRALLGLAVIACLASSGVAEAQTPLTWNVTSGIWQTNSNWLGGSAPANDTTTNTAAFVNTVAETASLNANASIAGLTFSGAGTKLLQSDTTTARVLTIGTSGITVNAGSGAVTLGNATNVLNLEISGGQIWTNSSTSTLTVLGTIRSSNSTAGTDTLTITGTGNTALSGALGDNVLRILALTKTNTGTLTLSGSNTFTGGATLTGGLVRAGNNAALGTGTITFNGGGLSSDSTTARSLANAMVFTGDGTLGNATSSGPLTLSGAVDLGGATRTLTVLSSATLSGVVSNGGLTKAGAGVLALSGSNTYTGPTTINAGALQFASRSALYGGTTANWTRTNITANSGGILAVSVGSSGDLFTDADVATLLSGVGGTVNNNGLRARSSIGFDTTSATSGTFTLGSVVADTAGTGGGAVGLVKLGAGTLVVQGANTFTGTTAVGMAGSGNAGTLRLASTGTISGIASVFGGTLDFNGNNRTLTALNVGGGAAGSTASVLTGSGTLTLGGNVTFDATNNPGGATISGNLSLGNANRTFTVNDSSAATNDLTIDAVISSGSLTKAGSGALLLLNANTFTGGATLSAGTIFVGNNAALGTGTITFGGGTLASDSTTARSFTNDVAFTGNYTLGSGNAIYAGPLTLSGSVNLGAATRTLTVSSSATLSGVVSNGGLTKAGTGVLTLSNANTFASGATLSAGMVFAGNNAALGTGTITFNGGGLSSDSTAARSFTNAVAFTGDGTLGNATNTGPLTLSGSVNLGAATRTLTVSSSATLSGVISGSAGSGLTKAGTGVLTLSGSNSYSGATTIQAGGLILDYSAQDNSKLGDSAALTLGSAGATASVTLSGGSHVEAVGSTTLGGGYTTIARSGGSSTLRLNAITRSAGATIDFAEGSLADTDTINTNGILGAWATVATDSWAMNSTNAADGAITAYTAYTNIDATGSTLANDSTTNVQFNAAGPGGNVQLGAATTAVNTLRQNFTTAATVNTAGGTLRTSGIMVGSAGQSLTLGRAPGSGTLTAATAGGELMLINNSANPLRINALVADNTSASSLTKSGTGRVLVTGGASYTGPTAINAGTLEMRVLAGTTTLSGSISGPGGLVKSGGGALTLSATNSNFSGPITLAAGTLNWSAASNLGTGRINVTGNAGLRFTANAGVPMNNSAIVMSDGAALTFTSDSANNQLAVVHSPISGGSVGNPIRLFIPGGSQSGRKIFALGTGFRGNVTVGGYTNATETATLGHASNILFMGTVNQAGVVTFNNDVAYLGGYFGGGTFNRRLFGGLSTLQGANVFNHSSLPSSSNSSQISLLQTLNILPVAFNVAPNQPTTGNYANVVLAGGLRGTAGARATSSFDGPISLTVSSAAGDVYMSQGLSYSAATATNGTVGINGPGRLTLQTDSSLGVGRLTLSSTAFFTTTANITTTGTITLNAGSTLRLAGAAGRLSAGSHAGAIVNSGTLVYASGSNQTLSGIVSGAGAVAVRGDSLATTGTLTLSGANTFSGDTTVSSGGLVLDYATQNNGKLADGAAFTLGNAAVSLAGGSHAETVGSTSLAAGFSSIARSGGSSTINLNAITRSVGGGLDFGAADIATTDLLNTNGILGGWATVAGVDWAVNSTNAADGSITALGSYTSDTWSSGNNTTVTTDGNVADAVTNSLRFNDAAGTTLTLSGTGTLESGGILVTANVGANASTITGGALRGASGGELFVTQNNTVSDLTIASQIVDNGAATALTKAGSGRLVVSGNNSYTGGTFLDAGTLAFANGGLGSTGSVRFVGSSTLQWDSGNTQDISSRLAIDDGVIATFDTNGNDVTLSGSFGGGGAGGLTKVGSGRLILSGSNSFTGPTTVSAGVLELGNANGLAGSTLTAPAAGLFSFGSLTSATLGGLTGATNLVLENGSGAGVALAIGANNSPTLTYSGVLSGAGSFEKTGYGRLILTGANQYSGPTTISNGYVTLSGGANRLPAGTSLSFANQAGAILDLNGQVQVIGSLTGGGTAGGHVWVNNGTLFVGNATSGTYSGYFIDNGLIVKQGAGTLTLSGESTFGGTLRVDAGTVRMQGDNRLGLFYNPVIGDAGTLDLNGFSAMVASLRGSGTVAMKDGTGALTVRSQSNLRNTFSGRLTGFGALIKEAGVSGTSGWLTLTNANNDYSGGTQLAGGRLEFASGALGSTGQITVTTDPYLGGASVIRWLAGNTQDISSRLVIVPGVTATLDTNGNDVTFATGIGNGGFGSLTKMGLGTLSLAAANTYTGLTSVNAGTVRLDFAAAGAPASDILADESALAFGGGTLLVRGNASGSVSQSLANVALNAGGGSLLVNPNGGTGLTVNLGTITGTAAGSALLVGTQSGAGGGTGTITTLTGTDATGIYGGRVVFTDGSANGFNWATSTAASGVSTLAGLASGGYATLASSAGTDTANSLLAASATLGGSRTTNTLKIEQPAAGQSLALGANTLTLTGGGLLATGSNGFSIAGTAGATRLTAGNGSGSFDLVVHQYNTGGLDISAVIGNNSTNATSLTKAGSGNLTLSGANTFTGGVFLNSGTLTINHATALGTAASRLTIQPGTTIDTTSGAAASSLTLSSTNPQTWNGDFTYLGTGGRSLNTGTAGTVTLGNDVNLAVNGGTLTVGAIGSSGFGLTKSGAGTLAFGAANTFTGPLTVASGTVTSQGANMPNTDIVLADVAGAAIVLSSNAATIQSLSGGGSAGGNVAIAANQDLTIAGNASTTYGGRLTGGGGSNFFTMNGAGTLTLTNASNNFTNTIRVNQGTLAFTSSGALGAGTQIQFNAGGAANAGRLVYTGTASTTLSRLFTMSTTTEGVIESAGTGPLVVTGSVAATAGVATLTLTGTGTQAEVATLTQSSGVVSVNKTGSGLWRLTGNSNYSGRLTVLDGTIVVGSAVNIGQASPFGGSSAAAPIIGNSAAGATGTAALLVQGGLPLSTGGGTIDRSFSVAQLGSGSASQVVVLGVTGTGLAIFGGSQISLGRSVTLQASDSGTARFGALWKDSNGNDNPVVAYTIGSAGNAGVVQLEKLLSGSATGVSIVNGTAQLFLNGGQGEQIDPATPVTIGSTLGAATLDLNGLSQTLSNLTFAGNSGSVTTGTVAGGTLRLVNSGSVSVSGMNHVISSLVDLVVPTTFDIGSASSLTVSNVISSTSGAMGLTKTGAGILELSGTSSYSGVTSVAAGTLRVNGQLGNTAVTVQSGATLGGSGRLAGSLTGDGLIAPGNSPGILTVDGQITPTPSTAFAFELTGTGSPTWSNASASINDVLRLTNADPFTSGLGGGNVVNIYFDVESLAAGNTFLGGFFTDNGGYALETDLANATYAYFVKGNGGGLNTYNGTSYYTLAQYMVANPSVTGVTRSVVPAGSTNFADGTISTGQVTQFVIVPEPASLALAAIGIAAATWAIRRRK